MARAPRSRTAGGRLSGGDPSPAPSPPWRRPAPGAEFRAPTRSGLPGPPGPQSTAAALPPRSPAAPARPVSPDRSRERAPAPSLGWPPGVARAHETHVVPPPPFPGDPHPPPASAESTSSSAAIAFFTAAAQAQERTSKPADRPTGRPRAAAALKTAPPAHASSSRWDDPRARPLRVPAARPRSGACAARLSRASGGTGQEGQPDAAGA